MGLLALCLAPPAGRCAAQMPDPAWQAVTPGVLRSAGMPTTYALVEDGGAVLIGAGRTATLDSLKPHGVQNVELVLLTHHHRDGCALAEDYARQGVTVRAPAASAPWLSPEGVAEFWKSSMPVVTPGRFPPLRERFWGQWSYLVVPEGLAGLECRIEEGSKIRWRGWTIQALATPGHSRDHFSFLASRTANADQPPIVFCGDAFCRPEQMWSPYTTDWDHWTDEGLKTAAVSLRKLAEVKPALLCPEHGPPLADDPAAALRRTADAVERLALLKSYEQYTKQRLGQPPAYPLLAPDQVATAGEKPWTRLSDHLFLTGNTYALVSKTGGLLLVDPYGDQIAEQVEQLRSDHKLGDIEVVLISHAHNDHYTGVFRLPKRDSFQVWTLDRVAEVLRQPTRYRAVYVDARPLRVDRAVPHGQKLAWHEYELAFWHLPGQTVFSMGVEVLIDGRKCFFTADNFFHADQFSGSGGWSGRNRALPDGYAASAAWVLQRRPEWVLAEHGGAFVFHEEDFRRRVQWAQTAAREADTLSVSGNHRHDWDPHRIRVEPLFPPVRNGRVRFEVVADNPLETPLEWSVSLRGRRRVGDFAMTLAAPPGETVRRAVELEVVQPLPPGRHVFPLLVRRGEAEDPADVFFVLDPATEPAAQ